jgi:hypothetical protein
MNKNILWKMTHKVQGSNKVNNEHGKHKMQLIKTTIYCWLKRFVYANGPTLMDNKHGK